MKLRRLIPLLGVLPLALVAQSAIAGSGGPFQGDDASFGSSAVGAGPTAAKTLTITATSALPVQVKTATIGGPNADQFKLQNNTCDGALLDALSPSCTVDVTFEPTSQGVKSATVDVNYETNQTAPGVSLLSGTGVTFQANVAPSSIPFASRQVGSPAVTQDVTVTNSGNGDITVVDSAIASQTAGAGFTQNDGCSGTTLHSGQTCTITVGFAPATAGDKTGSLQIDDTATGSPHTVALSGTATAPAVSLPATLGFGNVLLNGTASRTVTVTNSGNAPLNVTSIGFITGSPPFSVVANSNTCAGTPVPGGSSCQVTVAFHPTITGSASGTLRVQDDAAGSPHDLAVTGSSLSQFVGFTPPSWDFGKAFLGQLGGTKQFTLANKDLTPMTLRTDPVRISGTNPHSFTLTANGCTAGTLIPPNGSCTFSVRFTPTSTGPLAAQVREFDSSPDSPHGVALTGTASRPPGVTNLRGSSGCTATTVRWTPSPTPGVVGSRITRNSGHVPRGPGDGTVLSKTKAGLLVDAGLKQFQTYYYAIWTTYRFHTGEALVYSPRRALSLHTGRMCKPQNGAVIHDTTPLLRWAPQPHEYAYGLRIFDRGSNIFAWSKRTIIPRYQVQSSWRFRGLRRSLRTGHTYTVYIYAYTNPRPNGFVIGKSRFTIR